MPGLIEGASEGVGLGHEFLAHLERARMLVHVIDATEPVEERWRTIDSELAAYGAGLDARPQLVVLNKLDLLPDGPPPFPIDDPRVLAVLGVSCATGQGIDELRRRLFSARARAGGRRARRGRARGLPRLPAAARERRWRLLRTDRGFRVVGTAPAAELERALRAAGARAGAEVELDGETIELAP